MFLRNLIFILASLVLHQAMALTIPAPPQVAAKGHLLFEMHSGQVLAENNADAPLEPASLTKIMTAYVVFRELKEKNIALTDEVLVSKKAWKTPGSRMFIEVNKKVRLEDLIRGMIVQSGNDASVALAEHIAGSEATFASLMNQHAQRLGMTNTHFANATGLPAEGHITTPNDIVKVAAATIREFPEWYKIYAEKSFTFNKITQNNRNKLLWRDDSVDGIKTGHTEAAGFCLVSAAQKDNMRLIAVVMGTASESARAAESQKLLNYGFRFFETHRLYGKDDLLTTARVFQGDIEGLDLGFANDLYVTIPRKGKDLLQTDWQIRSPLIAPISQGQNVGSFAIHWNDQPMREVPIIAKNAVAEGGIFSQAIDGILLWFE